MPPGEPDGLARERSGADAAGLPPLPHALPSPPDAKPTRPPHAPRAVSVARRLARAWQEAQRKRLHKSGMWGKRGGKADGMGSP